MDGAIRRLLGYLRKQVGKGDPQFPLLREVFHEVVAKTVRGMSNFIQGTGEARKSITESIQETIINSKLKIEVLRSDIELAKRDSSITVIPAKALFTKLTSGPWKYEVDCFVSYGDWGKLGELRDAKIDIMDHLSKLLPRKQHKSDMGPVGLVTFQNGMHNDVSAFKKISESLVKQFSERPLCIGLHNPTWGGIPPIDMIRFRREVRVHPSASSSLFHMIKTLGEALPSINPNLIWVHAAHSEGALIANEVFDLGEEKGWLAKANPCIKKQLISLTYGAVTPIRDAYAFRARNTYSLQDIVLFMSQRHFDIDFTKLDKGEYTEVEDRAGNTYTIRVIDSELHKSGLISDSLFADILATTNASCTLPGIPNKGLLVEFPCRLIYEIVRRFLSSVEDHGFTNDSYDKALEDDIKDLKDEYEIYNPKASR